MAISKDELRIKAKEKIREIKKDRKRVASFFDKW